MNLLDDLFPNIDTDTYRGSGLFEQPMDTNKPSTLNGNNGKGEGFEELLTDFNKSYIHGAPISRSYHLY